jgi:N-terminal half of MaoC dehydratase
MSNKQDWMRDWQPLIDRIGSALDDGPPRFGPDAVELGAIRRWLEPLEFDCALHRDPAVATAHGWPGVIAPYTAVWTFMMPAVWAPGEPTTFDDPSRDAQPWRSGISDDVVPGAPVTTAVFGTSVSMEFERPLRLGERVGIGPRRLVDCVPKQTSVGRGAFVTFDRHILAGDPTGDLEPICRAEAQIYLYNPVGAADA